MNLISTPLKISINSKFFKIDKMCRTVTYNAHIDFKKQNAHFSQQNTFNNLTIRRKVQEFFFFSFFLFLKKKTLHSTNTKITRVRPTTSNVYTKFQLNRMHHLHSIGRHTYTRTGIHAYKHTHTQTHAYISVTIAQLKSEPKTYNYIKSQNRIFSRLFFFL